MIPIGADSSVPVLESASRGAQKVQTTRRVWHSTAGLFQLTSSASACQMSRWKGWWGGWGGAAWVTPQPQAPPNPLHCCQTAARSLGCLCGIRRVTAEMPRLPCALLIQGLWVHEAPGSRGIPGQLSSFGGWRRFRCSDRIKGASKLL